MADEAAAGGEGAAETYEGGGDGAVDNCPKCPDCPPGLPAWMATFSDLVTLLLTFFVLLLSFAKTESAKYEAALGSIRNAFGGNVLQKGEILKPGKSPDDQPTMIDAQEPIKPFPIEFLTMEGLLSKHEINRESTESLREMRAAIKDHELADNVDIYEMNEGIKIEVKDKIYFEKGSIKVKALPREVLDKMLNLLKNEDWTLFIQGHASRGETARTKDGTWDALILSAKRAEAVTRSFVENGVGPDKITTIFYGDTRPMVNGPRGDTANQDKNRRVEFIMRKVDLRLDGHKVRSK